jgi:hypothetical protein
MMAGCVFLIHFLVALWCDARNHRRAPRVEIIRLVTTPELTKHKGGRLRIYGADHFRVRDMTDSERDLRIL